MLNKILINVKRWKRMINKGLSGHVRINFLKKSEMDENCYVTNKKIGSQCDVTKIDWIKVKHGKGGSGDC